MTDKKPERRGLGRGLSALMADVGSSVIDEPASAAQAGAKLVPVEALSPNPDQPRRAFDPEALEELAASIRQKGIIQPLIVRSVAGQAERFEIVAGERRWRAAQLARLHEVPVLLRDLSDTEVLEIAIIENIQRADLNPVEEAAGYKQLVERFGHTQEQLAEAMGKSRSYIANLLRLLGLPQDIQTYLRDGRLSAGHARALITTPNPSELARQVISKGLSVRETEALARNPAKPRKRTKSAPGDKDADTRVIEQDLSANLGMSVVIDHRAGGEGRLTIQYKTLEQLDQLCQVLSTAR